MGPNSNEACTLTRTLEYDLHGLEFFSIPAGKTGVKGNLQKYVLVPFDERLIYVYGFVACLVFGTISLYYHIETSGDPPEPKSEISCANGLGEIVNTESRANGLGGIVNTCCSAGWR